MRYHNNEISITGSLSLIKKESANLFNLYYITKKKREKSERSFSALAFYQLNTKPASTDNDLEAFEVL
jgi:hypothetical protein